MMRLASALLWPALAVYFAAVIALAWNPTPAAQMLVAIAVAAAFVHGWLVYGLRAISVFLLICLVVTFTNENLGVATGFPFGHYHFEVGADLPHVGAIPVIVGFLWFGMGYFSWAVASIILKGADRRLTRTSNFIGLPIAAAIVMTFWDLVMDAPEATIAKVWIWHDGGAWFGVPWSNFLGWLLTAWIFYQAFAFTLRGRVAAAPASKRLGFAAILFYVSAGLTHLTPWLMGQAGTVGDATGHVWRIQDLRFATVAMLLVTMVPAALFAAWRLSRDSDLMSGYIDKQ